MKIKNVIIICLLIVTSYVTNKHYQNIYDADNMMVSQPKINNTPPKEINQQKMQEFVNNLNKIVNPNSHVIFISP